jgi:hypothetical protein
MVKGRVDNWAKWLGGEMGEMALGELALGKRAKWLLGVVAIGQNG